MIKTIAIGLLFGFAIITSCSIADLKQSLERQQQQIKQTTLDASREIERNYSLMMQLAGVRAPQNSQGPEIAFEVFGTRLNMNSPEMETVFGHLELQGVHLAIKANGQQVLTTNLAVFTGSVPIVMKNGSGYQVIFTH